MCENRDVCAKIEVVCENQEFARVSRSRHVYRGAWEAKSKWVKFHRKFQKFRNVILWIDYCEIFEKYLVWTYWGKIGRNREKNKENVRNYEKISFNIYLNKYDD